MWRGFAWIPKQQYRREESMGEFFKFGEGLRGFAKSNIGGRKLWRKFSKNVERVCVDFQKTIMAGGNYGGFF